MTIDAGAIERLVGVLTADQGERARIDGCGTTSSKD